LAEGYGERVVGGGTGGKAMSTVSVDIKFTSGTDAATAGWIVDEGDGASTTAMAGGLFELGA
jgi:hypothetical protein